MKRTKRVNTPLQQAIIDSWKKTKVVHPSYGAIANELGCSVATVFNTVKRYLKLKSDAKQ
jgi:hypothetical protein